QQLGQPALAGARVADQQQAAVGGEGDDGPLDEAAVAEPLLGDLPVEAVGAFRAEDEQPDHLGRQPPGERLGVVVDRLEPVEFLGVLDLGGGAQQVGHQTVGLSYVSGRGSGAGSGRKGVGPRRRSSRAAARGARRTRTGRGRGGAGLGGTQVRNVLSSCTSFVMWPESTGVPSALNRSRNHGLTLPCPELLTEPTGMNLAPERWMAAMLSKSSSVRHS